MNKNLGYERVTPDKRVFAFLIDFIIKIMLFFAILQVIIIIFVNPQTKGKPEQLTEFNVSYNLKHPDYDSYGFSDAEITVINTEEEKFQNLNNEYQELLDEGKSNEAEAKLLEREIQEEVARKYCLNKDLACSLTEEQMNKYLEDITPIVNSMAVTNLISIFATLLVVGFIYSFFVPLIFKNGQTLGRKLLKLGLVTSRGNRIKNINLFIRVTSAVISYFIIYLITGPFVFIILIVFNPLLVLVSKNSLQDFFSSTAIVDLTKQSAIEPESKLNVV